jgi:hypothetical protein
MVNFIICEHGLKVANPFLNVFFPELNDTKKRKPFSTKEISLLHDSLLNCVRMSVYFNKRVGCQRSLKSYTIIGNDYFNFII